MTTFSHILESRNVTPLRHSTIKLESFADDWTSKPPGDFVVGLRKFSDGDAQTARAEAAKYAVMMHDDHQGQVEAFNDALMRWVVVRGTCDANDVTQNSPLFEGSEEVVRQALTSNAIRFLWDEIERFHVERSPVVSEATNEEFLVLSEMLKNPSLLDSLTPGAQKRVRKLLSFCLSEFLSLGTEDTDDEPESPE